MPTGQATSLTESALSSRRVTDPELVALPAPRRPWRRLTLFCLALVAALSVLMLAALHNDVRYALELSRPNDLGELSRLTASPRLDNTWVSGKAELEDEWALAYERPLDADSFRLAMVSGNAGLWVQVRVPAALEGPHFVPPTTFTGRLLPVTELGLRHAGLNEVLKRAKVPERAYILLDGEAPATTRWVLGIATLLAGFCAFSFYGLLQLLRPLRSD